MKTYQDKIFLNTTGHRDMHDITPAVTRIIAASEISEGLCHIFNIGSTGSVGMIEYEPGLESDLPEILDRLVPAGRDYGHEQAWHDGNAHSHLQASMMGPGLTVPVSEAAPCLGTWQQIFHLECDVKPRRREIVVTVMGT